ncbi:AAA family ATPase [Fructobacillus papyrifericola]|uniref:AAA family ATPase n=1 Tax=Fructobacillus papyrifericola TaxID=2713172 RepID=A0ABS5QSI2_9LACO|nr:AAA family ATPase [Fructobacillus papyrifericola]MBS9335887.1 AAA family ATPase [Fructobacillus papyrifericola]
MKIEEIQISGFGKWSSAHFTVDQDFQVLTGPNESGKSTLKAFVLGVFFGFPKGRKSDQQLFEPRSGARYGGSLTIACQKGRYRIERMGRTQSTLTVTSLSNGLDLPNPEDFLKALFAPLEAVDYRQIFSFDEGELSQVANLTAGDFDQVLLAYTRPQAQRFLNWATEQKKLAEKAFASGKNGKRPLNLASRAYQKLLQQKQEEEGKYQDYRRLQEEARKLEKQLDRLHELRSHQQAKQAELQDLIDSWPLFVESQKRQESDGLSAQQVLISPEAEEQIRRLDQEGRFLKEQILHNQEDLQTLQSSLQQPAGTGETSQNVQQTLTDFENVQAEGQRLLNQVALTSRLFEGALPRPLSKREKELLTKSTKAFSVAALASGLLALLAFFFGQLLFSGAFVLLTLLSFTGLAVKKRRQKRILERFYPLDLDAVLADQEKLQAAWRNQEDFEKVSSDLALKEAKLREQLVDFNLLQEAQLKNLSTAALQQWTHRFLAENTGQKEQQQRLRLQEALRLQSRLAEKKDAQQRALYGLLAEQSVATLADFYQALKEQKQEQQDGDRVQLIRRQIGEKRLANLQARFEKHGKATEQILQTELAAAKRAVEEQAGQEKGLQQALANNQSARLQLEKDGGLSAVEQALENQASDLKEDFTSYLAESLAEEVVKKAFLGKDGDQGQAVLKQAGAYLAQLTAGRYQEITLVKGKLIVSSGREQGDFGSVPFQAAELSSGSRDLLYLAIRLALAMTLTVEEPLPLLIDDAFVHLDKKRRESALALIQEIATENQVLYWTFDERLESKKALLLSKQ